MRQLINTFRHRLFQPTETLDGYEQSELVEVIFQKTKAYQAKNAWPEMVGVKSVLDFGGACGLHYKNAALQSPDIRWAVVETAAMVARASELATDRLRFFSSIKDAAAWLGSIDVMHSNGALQYTSDPLLTLNHLCELGASKMYWQRMSLSANHTERSAQVSNLIDNGPGVTPTATKNKKVKFTLTKIPERSFLAAHTNYILTDRGSDWFQFTKR